MPFRTGYTLALPRAARPDLDLELEPTGQGRAASKGTKLLAWLIRDSRRKDIDALQYKECTRL